MAELDPEDFNWFRTQKRKVNETYRLGASENQFAQDSLRAAFPTARGDLIQKYADMRMQQPGGFAARGLLNSGIFQKAQTDLATERDRALADQSTNYTTQLGALQAQMGDLERTRRTGLDDAQSDSAARRAAILAALTEAGYPL